MTHDLCATHAERRRSRRAGLDDRRRRPVAPLHGASVGGGARRTAPSSPADPGRAPLGPWGDVAIGLVPFALAPPLAAALGRGRRPTQITMGGSWSGLRCSAGCSWPASRCSPRRSRATGSSATSACGSGGSTSALPARRRPPGSWWCRSSTADLLDLRPRPRRVSEEARELTDAPAARASSCWCWSWRRRLVVEELFYRGSAGAVAGEAGPPAGLWRATVFFGVAHFQALQLPALVLFGLVAGLLVTARAARALDPAPCRLQRRHDLVLLLLDDWPASRRWCDPGTSGPMTWHV